MKRILTLILGLCATSQVLGTGFTLSDTPLFISTGVAPNIVMTLDDSGSMTRAYVPDGLSSYKSNKRFKSAYFNALYYNPKIQYYPPPRYNGANCTLDGTNPVTCYPNITDFTAVPINGFDVSKGATVNSSSTCNPKGVSNKKYSPVNMENNYSATSSYDPSDDEQTCTAADGAATTTTHSYSHSCKVSIAGSGSTDVITLLKGSEGGCDKTTRNEIINNLQTVTGQLTISGAGSPYNGSYTVDIAEGRDITLSGNPWTVDSSGVTATLSFDYTTASGSTSYPAYYYLFYTEVPTSRPANCTTTLSAQKDDDDCYIKVLVGSTQDAYINPNGTAASVAQKKQNFVNWYAYYRTRNLATVSSAMRAFETVDGNVRVAWQALNTCNAFATTCKGWDAINHDNRIRKLGGSYTAPSGGTKTHKQELYEWLEKFPAENTTPLRSAMKRAGDYYMQGTVNGPYAEDPQVTLGTEYACRANYHIMMTDGLWNGDTGIAIPGGGASNYDNASKTLPDGKEYTAIPPYKDGNSTTLADFAFYYWANDLRADIGNNVLASVVDRSGDLTSQYWNAKNDPATWQHMVTFTMGFGLSDLLTNPLWGGNTYAGDYPGLVGGSVTWPNPSTNDSNKVADLWHAAINSRGQFFSVESSNELATAFEGILQKVAATSSSSASLAANSTRLEAGTIVYQAKFDSAEWSGQLIAFPVQGDGSIGSAKWDAGLKVSAAAGRKIFTTGQHNFEWASLTAAQQTALNKDFSGAADTQGQNRLAWIRGDHSKEQRFSGGIFRNRKKSILDEFDLDSDGNTSEYIDYEWVMGDIINSNPVYVGPQSQSLGSLPIGTPGQDTYDTFVEFKKTRLPVIYVGANDGMLHAIQADIDQPNSGAELFAVIPNSVYADLHKLPETSYVHQYYMDGSPNFSDAYLNNSLSHSSGWNTVVVQSMGGGGSSVFAVDATKTDAASITANKFMWEYTDADMGYTMGQVQIGRLNNGQWAAIFANGYKTSGGGAYLYIVNLSNGTLIRKIGVSGGADNGLSTPAVLDTNNDKTIDYVYAGDLNGNIWKFDLRASSEALWGVDFGGSPLFVAQNSTARQPITVQPALMQDPTIGGYWVYFGTGRFFANSDNVVLSIPNEPVQSIYGIWDNQSSAISYTNRTDILIDQTIDQEATSGGYSYRLTSNKTVPLSPTVRGWYLDLLKVGTSYSVGERVVSRAITVRDNLNAANSRVIFVTLIPNNDPCKTGGDSWLMEFNLSGGQPPSPVFDINADQTFDDSDKLSGHVPTGIKSIVGIVPTPTWVDRDKDIAFKLLSGTSGGIMSITNRGRGEQAGVPVRVYWYQLL